MTPVTAEAEAHHSAKCDKHRCDTYKSIGVQTSYNGYSEDVDSTAEKISHLIPRERLKMSRLSIVTRDGNLRAGKELLGTY